MLYPEVLDELTKTNNFGYEKANKETIKDFKENLVDAYNSSYRRNKNDMLNESTVVEKEFFKVRFTEALDLVRTRKVFLHQGEILLCCPFTNRPNDP